MSEIKLGVTARDPVTKFEGIVSMRADQMNGNVQWVLQPPVGEDGKLVEAQGFDAHLLEYVDAGISAKVPPIDTSFSIELGDVVKDTLSGVKGTAFERIAYLNGCVYFNVQPMGTKAHERPDRVLLMPINIEVVSKVKPAEAAKIKAAKPTGGPIRSAREFRR